MLEGGGDRKTVWKEMIQDGERENRKDSVASGLP